ncbi:HET-domain-containing protein [Xylariaceae sp. FL0016]|nr:HET-domain-containing protein [Xylariaceae sp. FL0016]
MSKATGSYCYVPFGTEPDCDAFRIVQLFPGQGNDPIACVLEHVALGVAVDYEAVSYVWGDADKKTTITCNGLLLEVTANLHEALQHLRLPDRERSLWVDAICINQRDDDERSRQVRRMKRIYPKARRVVVWLGSERDNSDVAIEVARDLSVACRQYVDAGGTIDEVSFTDERAVRFFGPFRRGVQYRRLEAFAKLLQRPWFGRVWVIQEVAMATEANVLCGRASIGWEDLMDALTAQDRLSLHMADFAGNTFQYILKQAREEWHAGVELSLLTGLFRFRIFEATDPRDKVFGSSGLNRGYAAGASAAQADYTLSVRDLYCGVAREILQTTPRLNLLSVPRRFEGEGVAGLPSWVPDWTNTRLTSCLGLANYSDINDLAFAASGSSTPDIRFEDGGSALCLRSIFVDRIVAVGPVLKVEETPRMYFRGVRIPKCAYVLEDWLGTAKGPMGAEYKTGELMLDAFAQTLVAGSAKQDTIGMREQLSILRRYAVIARWARFLSRFPVGRVVDGVVHVIHTILFFRSNDQLALDFRINMSSMADRKVFRTEAGYMGLGTALAERGDMVAIVKGGRVPVILRPEGSKWTFQGDCYVRGIMDGSYYSEEACEDIEVV